MENEKVKDEVLSDDVQQGDESEKVTDAASPVPETEAEEEPGLESEVPVDEKPQEMERREVEETLSLSKTEFDRMLNEAEERGYLRGRNEKIETVMHKPNVLSQQPFVENEDNMGQLMILKELRRTCWE